MDKAPEIGQRVRYVEDGRECSGTVRRIYVKWNHDVEPDDPRWDDADFIPRHTTRKQERDWQATVEVDEPLPEWWPYRGTNLFAPSVSALSPA